MTFNEIEKEFDKEFVRDTGIMRVTPYSSSELPMADAIKSFLKQSFIKYLQNEVEACNQYKSYYNQTGDQFNKGKHEAMSHMINRLQAQIKEIDTN